MLLSVNLIVKDEAAHIAAALASVADLADEVVVHDTGSTDDTAAIARAAGATVLQGYWDDDFARARNVALEASSGEWIFSMDADERFVGDVRALRSLLARAPDGEFFSVLVKNRVSGHESADYEHRRPMLFRRDGTSWRRALHEVPVGHEVRTATDLPAEVAHVVHLGLLDDEQAKRHKRMRNARIAQAELDRAVARGEEDPRVIAPLLHGYARSMSGVERWQDAVDALELLRELVPGSAWYVVATAELAKVLLSNHQHDAVLVVAGQLQALTGPSGYTDWLVAEALFALDRPGDALGLLRQITQVVEPPGIEHDLGRVLEVRARAAARLGHLEESFESLARAMAEHGRVRGQGELLVALWGARPPGELADRLRTVGTGHLAELAEELRDCGDVGRAAAGNLAQVPLPS